MATEVVATAPLARLAPADRPRRHRGVRGRVSAVTAILALVALSTNDWHGHAGGGSGSGPGSYGYNLNGWRGWAPTLFALVAVAFLVAAAILWKARSRSAIVCGAVLVALAIAVGGWAAVVGQRFARVSATSYAAARLGTPQTQIEDRLGAPVTTDAHTTLHSGATIGCDVYRAAAATADLGGYFFCFRGGVLTEKFPWTGSL